VAGLTAERVTVLLYIHALMATYAAFVVRGRTARRFRLLRIRPLLVAGDAPRGLCALLDRWAVVVTRRAHELSAVVETVGQAVASVILNQFPQPRDVFAVIE
jgi:hypothetical protein